MRLCLLALPFLLLSCRKTASQQPSPSESSPHVLSSAPSAVVPSASNLPPVPLALTRIGVPFLSGRLRIDQAKDAEAYVPSPSVWIERIDSRLEGVFVDELSYGRKVQGEIRGNTYDIFDPNQPSSPILSGSIDSPNKGTLVSSWIDTKNDHALRRSTFPFSLKPSKFYPRSSFTLGGLVGSKAYVLNLRVEAGQAKGFMMGNDAALRTIRGPVSATGQFDLAESDSSGEMAKLLGIVVDNNWIGHRIAKNGDGDLFWFNEGVVHLLADIDLSSGFSIRAQPSLEFFPACYVDHLKPVVTGPGEGPARLNALIDKLYGNDENRDTCLESKLTPYGLGTERPARDSLDYSVVPVGEGRFGLALRAYSDSNGAHGLASDSCYLGEASTGRLIDLQSYLDSKARTKLTALVESAFRSQFGKKDLGEAGFFANAAPVGEHTCLCLSKTGVEVHFGLYELAPYAAGMPTVEIPKAKIRLLFEKDPLIEAVLR